jgi:hypothetical protein
MLKPLLVSLALVGSASAGSVRLGLTSVEALAALDPPSVCGATDVYPIPTGFSVKGMPQADVWIEMSCNGGRGSHTYYVVWVQATWDLSGNLLSAVPTASPCPTAWYCTLPPSGPFTSNGYTLARGTSATFSQSSFPYNYYPAALTTP